MGWDASDFIPGWTAKGPEPDFVLSLVSPASDPFRLSVFTRQPLWVYRTALAGGLLVFTAVIALLIIPAALASIVIFLAAAGLVGASAWLGGVLRHPSTLLHRREGRRNVRIVRRD
jgi:hypothetical protein